MYPVASEVFGSICFAVTGTGSAGIDAGSGARGEVGGVMCDDVLVDSGLVSIGECESAARKYVFGFPFGQTANALA